MKTPHLDNEINRLKWLQKKGDLSPIGENTLIEYQLIKEQVTKLKNNSDLGDVSNRFLAIQHYPEMKHNIDDVIEIPNEEWKHADGTYCDANYFRAYPEFFKEI